LGVLAHPEGNGGKAGVHDPANMPSGAVIATVFIIVSSVSHTRWKGSPTIGLYVTGVNFKPSKINSFNKNKVHCSIFIKLNVAFLTDWKNKRLNRAQLDTTASS
jgi:hypothetical protein